MKGEVGRQLLGLSRVLQEKLLRLRFPSVLEFTTGSSASGTRGRRDDALSPASRCLLLCQQKDRGVPSDISPVTLSLGDLGAFCMWQMCRRDLPRAAVMWGPS